MGECAKLAKKQETDFSRFNHKTVQSELYAHMWTTDILQIFPINYL